MSATYVIEGGKVTVTFQDDGLARCTIEGDDKRYVIVGYVGKGGDLVPPNRTERRRILRQL